MMDLGFWAPVMVGGTLTGATCGALGTYIVGMRIPFLAVCVSHAALAGAVFGVLGGLGGSALVWPALLAASAAALALGMLEARATHIDINVLIGMLFSLSMGVAFLGIGLVGLYGKSQNEVLSLLWGSVLFVQWRDVWVSGGVGLVLAAFVALFRKELSAILFSRLHAAAAGIPVALIWTGFLILTSAALTVNFQTVGGLMIYSLITNPALAAFQLARGHTRVLLLSATFGAVSGLGGFLLSYRLDLPTGATIVILSSVLVAAAYVISRISGDSPRRDT